MASSIRSHSLWRQQRFVSRFAYFRPETNGARLSAFRVLGYGLRFEVEHKHESLVPFRAYPGDRLLAYILSMRSYKDRLIINRRAEENASTVTWNSEICNFLPTIIHRRAQPPTTNPNLHVKPGIKNYRETFRFKTKVRPS